MKQVVQNVHTGEVVVLDAPTPAVKGGHVLVRNVASVVSLGTERQMMEFARKTILGKALERPDLVRRVVTVAQTEGIAEAYQQAMGRLDTLRPLGYSSAGVVVDVGMGVNGIRVGDRLACFGSGFACHADYVIVPHTQCAPIPECVSDEDAAFASLGAIALHALRLADVQLGERVVVIGLGLLGLLAVQIAKAWGCQVLGTDVASRKADLARHLGADWVVAGGVEPVLTAAQTFFHGAGADAVIILASTPSNEPLELAAELARVRGRIVVPGLVGLSVPRRAFYAKELSLRVSRAWGPGSDDPDREERGRDHPLPLVRWTARRNMEAFLYLLAQDRVRVHPLITHRFPIERATDVYHLIGSGKESCIGVVLTYPTADSRPQTAVTLWLKGSDESSAVGARSPAIDGRLAIGFIGAGNFARVTLLPVLRRLRDVHLRGIATTTGASARSTGDRFGFEYCTTDYRTLLNDPAIGVIIIATRHNTHAPLLVEALRSGKHVFVEKPLALNREQLCEVVEAYREAMGLGESGGDTRQSSNGGQPVNGTAVIMVGFNRRFSPFTVALKEWLGFTNLPMVIHCRVNAGFVPLDRWEQDLEEGGGRIVGEVCHFVDLIQYLTDARPVQVCTQVMKAAGQYLSEDNLVITLRMSDGSVASISYTASGDTAFPRERVEVFRGGAVGLIEDFRMASFTSQGRTRRRRNLFGVDRGHRAELGAFFSAVCSGGPPPVAFPEYILTTLTTFSIVRSIECGEHVRIEMSPALSAGLHPGGGRQR